MPPKKLPMSPLLMSVYSRRIHSFARATLQLLMLPDSLLVRENCATILRIVDTRVLAEIGSFPKSEGGETKQLVVRLLVQISCLEVQLEGLSVAATMIGRWYREQSLWKVEIEKCLENLVRLTSLFITPPANSALDFI